MWGLRSWGVLGLEDEDPVPHCCPALPLGPHSSALAPPPLAVGGAEFSSHLLD